MNLNNSTDLPPQPWLRANWVSLLVFAVVSRSVLFAFGLVIPLGNDASWAAMKYEPAVTEADRVTQHKLMTPGRTPLRPWYRWDAIRYMQINDNGYEYSLEHESTVAFFPLLPMIIRAGSALGLDPYWVGFLAPNLAYCIGLVGFGRVVRELTNDDGMVWRSCLLMSAFPTAFFLSAPYHESLGFALTAWAALFWMNNQPVRTALCAATSTLSRLACVSFGVAIIAEWFSDLIHRRPARKSAWPVAIATGLGGFCFFLYLKFAVGDFFASVNSQKFWGRKSGLPGVIGFVEQFSASMHESATFDIILVFVFLFVARPWITRWLPSLSRILRPWHGWALVLAGILILIASMAILRITPAQLVATLRREFWIIYQLQNNLAFALFMGLGVNLWIHRGPFWGCLALVPLCLAASTGIPLSIGRFCLSSFPCFIEMADLCKERWLFILLVLGMAFFEFFMFMRFAQFHLVI